MQKFSYLDKREVLQWEYSQPPILPSLHFRWVVKCLIYTYISISNCKISGHNTPLVHRTDRSPTGLGQYNVLGEYCGPHTAPAVFLISILTFITVCCYRTSRTQVCGWTTRVSPSPCKSSPTSRRCSRDRTSAKP